MKRGKLKMKNRKKYFIAHFVTDLGFLDDEYEMFCARNEEAVAQELREVLGEHLLAYEIRRATWTERRMMRKTHGNACIVH
jgi:hypothetical protein